MLDFKFKKKAIFLLKYDLNWIGGVYYKFHLISALRTVNKTILIIVYTESKNLDKVEVLLNGLNVLIKPYDKKILRGLGKVELYLRNKFNLSFVGFFDFSLFGKFKFFDFYDLGILRNVSIQKRIYWVPDLQDIYMPELFSESVLDKRKIFYDYISKYAKHLVFSSLDSADLFFLNYPILKDRNLKISILRFAVFHSFNTNQIDVDLFKFYSLQKDRYFIVSNQFMAHKNHLLVVKALNYVCKELNNYDIKIVFTGKTFDPRNFNYFNELKQCIIDFDLEKNIVITDLIPRNNQLYLLKNSLAIIQPSLFEGWNSTIEDAKSLNSNIICSDINIHREQLSDYPALFFDKNDYVSLGEILYNIFNTGWTLGTSEFDYNVKQLEFSKTLDDLFN